MEEILRSGFAGLGLELDGEALRRFRRYYEYLTERNRVMNLTSIEGEEDTARLHFLDCCALLTAADFAGKRVIDVGSGAGFPGIPLKIAESTISLTLMDSLVKRTGFLSSAAELLGLEDVQVVCARAEEAPRGLREGFDIAVSRAVARLNVLCELCLPFVRPGGLFIAMKGPDFAVEISEARHAIGLLGGGDVRAVPYSVPGTELSHAAVVIEKAAPTPDAYPRRWAKISKKPL